MSIFLLFVASMRFQQIQVEDINVALTRASYAGDNEQVRRMLAKGADVDTLVDVGSPTDTPGSRALTTYLGPPVLWAAFAGHASTVRILAEAGADVNRPDTSGNTALMWAVDYDRVDAIAALLELRADPEASPYTALMRSARRGKNEIVGLLLRHGAKINTLNTDYGTALMYSVLSQQRDTVRLLLEEGADPNIAGGRSLHGGGRWPDPGLTPLMVAASIGDPVLVRELLEHGATVDTGDEAGFTALDWATQEGHQEVIALLEKQKSK